MAVPARTDEISRMRLMLYLSGLSAVLAALIGIVSGRANRSFVTNQFPRAWPWFWYTVCVFEVVVAAHLGRPRHIRLTHWPEVAALMLAPGLAWLAAWQCHRGRTTRAGWFAGVLAVVIAVTGFGLRPDTGAYTGPLAPLTPAVLLTAAGMLWCAGGMARHELSSRKPGEWLTVVGTGAYGMHLAAVAFALPGMSMSGGPPVAGAAVDATLAAVILSGVLLRVSGGAGFDSRLLAAVWEATGAGLRLCDRAGHILAANPSFCRLVGLSERELSGRHFSECYADERSGKIASAFHSRVLADDIPEEYVTEVELRDGKRIWLELRNSVVEGIPGRPVLTAAFDVTSGKLAEGALLRRERQLKLLVDAVRNLHAEADPGAVMRVAVEAARELTGASGGGYRLRGGSFDGEAQCPDCPHAECWAQRLAGALPRALNTPELVSGSFCCLREVTVRNAVCVPVARRDGRVAACFEVHDTASGQPFDEQDVLMLAGLALSAADAVENAAMLEQRRRAEEKLARSEERYRSIVEGAPMGLHFYSLDSGRLVFRGWNRAAEELLGVAHQPLEGLPAESAFPELAGGEMREIYLLVAASGESWQSEEFEMGGRVFALNAFPTNPGSVALSFQDITERRRSELARQEIEHRYRLITGNSTDMISVHALDGSFTFVSPACRTLLGCEPEELVGADPRGMIHPDDSLAWRAAQQSVSAGQPANTSFRMRHREGRWVWVEATSRVGRHPESGEAREIVTVTRDISGRRELEERLQQAQKMESVGRLAGGVAHDFNNLLTVINGYAAVLAGELEESDPKRECVAEIAAAGARATGLTNQLLVFSRKQVLRAQVLDLNGIVADTEKILRRTIGEDIELRLIAGVRPATVKADPGQIQQVLLNLALNARDAMPCGGTLIFETARVVLAEPPGALPAGAYVVLTVSDNGLGMSEEVRKRIFEPFFTTKEGGRGTGLGLSTAFGIVAQSGGHIEAGSAPGQGTTMRIYLPEADEQVEPRREGPRRAASSGSQTILLVEDQDEVRRLASKILEARGYQVLQAGGAAEALRVCEAHPARIGLVLTDVVMPGMNGKELAERLITMRPGLAVTFMSGYPETAMPGGSADPDFRYLRKPFTAEELAGWVEDELARAGGAPVLVVDDDEGVRHFLRKVLELAGYQVKEAGNGREALRIADQSAVGLVITDVVMPEKEGLETIRDLRRRHPSVPVVAISGAFDGQFLDVAATMGAAATLKKPITPDALLSAIRDICRRGPGQKDGM